MKQCGHCGTQNLDQDSTCTRCGQPLPSAGAPQGLGGTLVLASAEPPPAAAAAAKPSNLKGTMIGLAPPNLAGLAAPAPDAAARPAGGSQPPPKFSGTMIGMAPPLASPPQPLTSPEATGGAPRLASAQKTVLGVARPGIAPLNPGQAKSAAAAAPPIAAAPVRRAQPAPMAEPPRPAARISGTAAFAIVGSAMLLAMATVAFLMLRGHGSVTARASLDAKGTEQLELSCSECPDGTKTWIDASPATFKNGRATLRLQSPLKVGENPLVLVLERPNRSREEIALSIPVEYRVRGSVEELSQDIPKVSVIAGALAGTQLEVDGKPVTPDASGTARLDYDVSDALSGPEASVKSLERTVSYEATSPSGRHRGSVEIRIGITPLVVDAPGASITVDSKDIVIAGRTAPGSTLKIGSQPVTLDPEGRFVSRQNLTVGDNAFVVRSALKDHAPRLVKVAVRRVEDLQREATLARSMAQTSYADVIRDGEAAVGRSVSLEGQLYDLRQDGYSSVLLVDVKGGCKKAPCLAKVVYGVQSQLVKGSKLKAFGKVVRFVDGPRTGQRIPELRADLVARGAP